MGKSLEQAFSGWVWKHVKYLMIGVFLTVLFAAFLPSAEATTNGHTRAEAVQWARDKKDTSIKYYTSPDTLECMDLAGLYYAYLGHPVSGLGCPNNIIDNIYNNGAYAGDKASIQQGWPMYDNSMLPMPGDIVLWKNTRVGHIGIILDVYPNYFTYIDYNGDADHNGNPTHCGGKIRESSGLYSFTKIIRPDFPPTEYVAPTVAASVSENGVTVSWNDVGAQSYYIYFLNLDTLETLEGENVGKNLSFSKSLADGRYKAYVTAVYSSDRMLSGSVEFTVEALRASIDKGMNGVYEINEPAVISLNANIANYDSCVLKIYHTPIGGNTYLYWEGQLFQAQYETAFPYEGYYSCCFVLLKNGRSLESAWVGWNVLKQRFTVSYDANGGGSVPESQVKERGAELILSDTVPIRQAVNDGGCTVTFDARGGTISPASTIITFVRLFSFTNWNTAADGSGTGYSAGAVYRNDENVVLYAQWSSTLVSDPITLPAPTRDGYTFLGWTSNPDAAAAQYQAGDRFTTYDNTTFYALWEITNPPSLRARDRSMLVGDTCELADFVELTHDGVLNYTLTATADGTLTVSGQSVTATAPGTGTLAVSVAEYPSAACTVTVRTIDLSAMLRVPDSLYEIGEEAFANCGVTAVTIPSGCGVVGSKAFADNEQLLYILIPSGVTRIEEDAFDNCPNLTIYCYPGSAAATLAQTRGIRCILLSDDWIPANELPLGATVTDEKWTYKRSTTETMTSNESSMEGWTCTGYEWQQTDAGTHVYANYPDGFDTGHSLYNAYAKSALEPLETATTKRTVSESTVKSYIYWHWTWYWGTSENKLINDHYCVEDGREYNNFKAYENSYIEYVSGHNYVKWERGGPEDGSCWWFRFDVLQNSYIDYQKLFTYTRTETSDETSSTPVTEGEGISNVLHWVKYEL